MSVETLETRAAEFVSMHKHDLARFLARAESKLKELGHDVASLFEDEPAAPVADLEMTEVPAASAEPEVISEAATIETEPAPVVEAVEPAEAEPSVAEPSETPAAPAEAAE